MTSITRRRLLKLSGAATAAAAAGARPWNAAVASADTAAPFYLSRSAYTGLVGQAFAAGDATLKLSSIGDLSRLAGRDDAFSLIFTAASGPRLGPATTPFSHPDLGSFELFIEPVGAAESTTYEAVVNRSNLPPAVASGDKPSDAPAIAAIAAPTPPKHSAPSKPPAKHSKSRLRVLRTRRLARGLKCELDVSPHLHAERVAAWLRRGNRVVATATVRHVRGRERLALRLPTRHRLRAGHYVLEVVAHSPHGHQTGVRSRVVLR